MQINIKISVQTELESPSRSTFRTFVPLKNLLISVPADRRDVCEQV